MSKSSKKRAQRPDIVRPVVFTGVQSILAAQVRYIQEVLSALKGNVFITGGCVGVDMFVSGELERLFPRARQIIVIPYGYNNGATEMHCAGMLRRGYEVIDMPAPTTDRHPNLLRNDYMCELAMELNPNQARLVAFPGGAVEQQRSGTWATVRSARRIRLPHIDIHPLSEARGQSDRGVFKSDVKLNPYYLKKK